MNMLNFSDNIVSLRRKKGITQEELADFVGVTKASVSKWETKQSLPDILLLPQLAAFFSVTVDELLGYEPQLGREQIQKIYHGLACDFAQQPFEAVFERSRELVKKYYSCYPFLYQMCILWLNHFVMAQEQLRRMEVLKEAADLCAHIMSDCDDLGLCSDAVIMKATIDLQRGEAREVIGTLEGMLNPYRISNQSDTILIQAYRLGGEQKKADSFTQMSMFTHLTLLVGSMMQYLDLHSGEPDVCDETIRRIDCLVECFGLERLHPNSAAGFQYQAAIIYCTGRNIPETLKRLEKFVSIITYLLTGDNLRLCGDSYFTLLDDWFEGSGMGTEAPRDRRVILDSTVQAMNHPAFSILQQNGEFLRLKKRLIEEGNL